MHRRMTPCRAALVLLLAVGCGGASSDSTANAIVGTAAAVAGAGISRATTKGCWGQCLSGLVCDHQSGMCVRNTPCSKRCAVDERCEEGVVARCVPLLDRDRDASADATVADADAGR